MSREPWDYETDDDMGTGAAMEEICHSEEAALVQVTGVRHAHATKSDDEVAEGDIRNDDDELAEGGIDSDDESNLESQQLSGSREPRLMGAVLDIDHLRQLTNDWSEQCAITTIGLIATVFNGGEKKMTEAIKIVEEVDFARFVHCKWCYRPQAICELWNRSVNSQGRVAFNKKPGVDCTFGRWVLEAVAAFLAFGVKDNLEEWRREDRNLRTLKQQMGKKFRRGEVECSGLFMYFYKWA
ncbi:hypothetical protein E4U59_000744 [Claviceps monticola]|nr:hypothetical protein E4U59_000744 [Claviceps monticola]